MRFFQNWHALGEQSRKEEKNEKQRFETMYGLKEEQICKAGAWELSDFRKHFSKDLVFVHFNGDSKVPLMSRCIADIFRGRPSKSAKFVVPDLDAVVNCPDGPHLRRLNTAFHRQMNARLAKQHEAMKPAWVSKFPYEFNQGPCGKGKNFKMICPPDDTLDKKGKGQAAYGFDYASASLAASRGLPTGK